MLRSLLIKASESRALERAITAFGPTKRVVDTFVSGTTLDDGLATAAAMVAAGRSATLDYLGEAVTDATEARAAAKVYVEALGRIGELGIDCGVSVKPTQMGLDLDRAVCHELLSEIAAAADAARVHLTLDMEGSDVTEDTVALVEALRAAGHGDVGCAVQAYLHRTPDDLERLCRAGASLRLCKGAYAEPEELAITGKHNVRAAYARCAMALLRLAADGVPGGGPGGGLYPRLATHDDALIDGVRRFTERLGIAPDLYEFQMLYGVRPALQEALVADGYRLRVYIPFGAQWYPYFMRRLAERPANVTFFLRAVASRQPSPPLP